jgi:hypothetical protein
MQDKIQSLRKTLEQYPPDGKLLQMQLQGGIATAVNQVLNCGYPCLYIASSCLMLQGPFHIAQLFLDVPKSEHTHLHRRLKVCFKEFTRRWARQKEAFSDSCQ